MKQGNNSKFHELVTLLCIWHKSNISGISEVDVITSGLQRSPSLSHEARRKKKPSIIALQSRIVSSMNYWYVNFPLRNCEVRINYYKIWCGCFIAINQIKMIWCLSCRYYFGWKDCNHWEDLRNVLMIMLFEVDILLLRSISALSVSEQWEPGLGTLLIAVACCGGVINSTLNKYWRILLGWLIFSLESSTMMNKMSLLRVGWFTTVSKLSF